VRVSGIVRVPGDKSISHRALLCAALGTGTSRFRGLLDSADVRSTAGVLRALGVAVPALGPEFEVPGVGLRGFHASASDLDCGNSGTTARLVAGLAAAQPFHSHFVGDASLSRRPMRRVARPLVAMGAEVDFEHGDGLPMTVRGGALRSVVWRTETASAQTKSAVLFAGLVGGVPATVEEPARSRDHTELMLGSLGVPIRASAGRDGEHVVALEPVRELPPLALEVPGDPSSAAFFAALAALADEGEIVLPGVCTNDTRAGFFEVLRLMGARVDAEESARDAGGEPVRTLRVSPGTLHGVSVGGERIPSMIDELPLLACLGARAEGETVISGAAELRVKESDRIAAVVANLRAVGVEAEERPDGMRVMGGRGQLRGRVQTHGDHRLAMAFGVLGALPGSRIEIDDRDCVAVSYPGFWRELSAAVA
jgi:3-phosphoshikimate 1-carboxyvinyltransferase